MNNPLDLEAIRKRAESATAGPWEADHSEEDNSSVKSAGMQWWDGHAYCGKPENAEFIAHARTDVPALVAEVERLRAERADIWDAGFDAGFVTSEGAAGTPNPHRADAVGT